MSGTVHPSGAQETLSLSPKAAGDLLALAIETRFPSTPSFTAASVVGGGVSTWHKALSHLTADGTHDEELWWGTVTTPGPSMLRVGFTPGAGSGTSDSASSLDVAEFRSTALGSTVWSADVTGELDTAHPSTTPAYPALTASKASELYFGYLVVPGAVRAGTTPGVEYREDACGNQVASDTSVSGTITPTASSPAQTSSSIGMLVSASPTIWWASG